MRTFLRRTFAWTGAALFAVSLLTTGWLYLVILGRPHEGPEPSAAVLDGLLFAVFATHHSLFARSSVKRFVALAVSESLVRSVYVWAASLLLISVCLLWRPVGGTVYSRSGLSAVPFWLVQLFGVGLILGAVRAIHALGLAGLEPARTRDELQVTGVYGQVRHPLYLGWILVTAGTAHMTGDRAIFAAVTTVYILLAIPWEERSLAREFGAGYDRYRAQVPWRVLPYVY